MQHSRSQPVQHSPFDLVPPTPIAPQALVLVACLALLARGAAAACATEESCAGAACTDAFSLSASKLPYTVEYTSTGDSETTTFVFKVCV